MAYGIDFTENHVYFYNALTTKRAINNALYSGNIDSISPGHDNITWSNNITNNKYRIVQHCCSQAQSNAYLYDIDNTSTPQSGTFFPVCANGNHILDDNDITVSSDTDTFSDDDSVYFATSAYGMGHLYSDTTSMPVLTSFSTGIIQGAAISHDIPIDTGTIVMQRCDSGSYVCVDGQQYTASGSITGNANLIYVGYYGFSCTYNSAQEILFGCTILYKVVFPTAGSNYCANITRTSVEYDSQILLNILTNNSNLNLNRISVSANLSGGNDTGTVLYYFCTTEHKITPGASSSSYPLNFNLNATFYRGSLPFNYNFTVLINKILPANKNYYLQCKRQIGKTINFYFLQKYENNMTPSSLEFDLLFPAYNNSNTDYSDSDNTATYLSSANSYFVYPVYKTSSSDNELLMTTTFINELKYLSVSNPTTENKTTISDGYRVTIPAVSQSLNFSNLSKTHTPFGYTQQYKVVVKPNSGTASEIVSLTKTYTLNFHFLYYGENIPYIDSGDCLNTYSDYSKFDLSGDTAGLTNKVITGKSLVDMPITNIGTAGQYMWYGMYKTAGTPGIVGFTHYSDTANATSLSPDGDEDRCIQKTFAPFEVVYTGTPGTGEMVAVHDTTAGITGEYASTDRPVLIQISGQSNS